MNAPTNIAQASSTAGFNVIQCGSGVPELEGGFVLVWMRQGFQNETMACLSWKSERFESPHRFGNGTGRAMLHDTRLVQSLREGQEHAGAGACAGSQAVTRQGA